MSKTDKNKGYPCGQDYNRSYPLAWKLVQAVIKKGENINMTKSNEQKSKVIVERLCSNSERCLVEGNCSKSSKGLTERLLMFSMFFKGQPEKGEYCISYDPATPSEHLIKKSSYGLMDTET